MRKEVFEKTSVLILNSLKGVSLGGSLRLQCVRLQAKEINLEYSRRSSLNGTLSIAFIIRNVEITLRLEEFARIHRVPCRGVPPGKTRKVKGVDITLDPFQNVIFELKINLKKWEIILSENAISLTGNKDHPNVYLCYMIYCLTIGKPFNLAYYIAKRMVSVTKSADMTLTYGLLLTRLFDHVRVAHPHAFLDDLYLVDHVMIPLSKKESLQDHAKWKKTSSPNSNSF
ncbi:hypothetical protein Tco_1202980 [Tanacetum coccineum]